MCAPFLHSSLWQQFSPFFPATLPLSHTHSHTTNVHSSDKSLKILKAIRIEVFKWPTSLYYNTEWDIQRISAEIMMQSQQRKMPIPQPFCCNVTPKRLNTRNSVCPPNLTATNGHSYQKVSGFPRANTDVQKSGEWPRTFVALITLNKEQLSLPVSQNT